MTPTPADRQNAKANPWRLTAHQCMAMRLYCEHGCLRRVENTSGIAPCNIKYHLNNARHRMKFYGNDIRVYLTWDRWARAFSIQTPTEVIK